MHLNRDRIVSAALELLDAYGLGDVTMRRVGTALNVAPGALYWHFPNKQALLAAVAERILEPIISADDAAAEGTDQGPITLCLSVRRALLTHRDGAEVVSAAVSQPESPAWEALVGVMEGAIAKHLPYATPRDRHTGAITLTHFVLGAVLTEQARAQLVALTRDAKVPLPHAHPDGEETLRRGAAMVIAGLEAAS